MDLKGVITNEKSQAMPTGIVSMGSEAFAPRADTTLTWLDGASILLNARGTRVMIDGAVRLANTHPGARPSRRFSRRCPHS